MSIVDHNDGDDPDPGQPVYPANNSFDLAAFVVNGDAVVAVENESWGNVKALFR